MAAAFLRARWASLAMLNYPVDPELVRPLAPAGTEIDLHSGQTFVSLVGFMFLDTRLLGVPPPLHTDFEEVNLRFYVRRGERRGVAFAKEIVPRRAIAAVARAGYNEPYVSMPMKHRLTADSAVYSWRHQGRWNSLEVNGLGTPVPAEPGSREEFIAEHHFGYSRQRDGGTVEYEVHHPPWLLRTAGAHRLEADTERLYGPDLARVLDQEPSWAFLAEGSAVSVGFPRRL